MTAPTSPGEISSVDAPRHDRVPVLEVDGVASLTMPADVPAVQPRRTVRCTSPRGTSPARIPSPAWPPRPIGLGTESRVYGHMMRSGGLLAVGALLTGFVLAGCGSSSSSPPTTTSTTTGPAASTTTAVVPTTAAGTTTAATCPTLAQANAALGATYSGPISTSTPGGGIVCEYTGGIR